MQHSKSFHLSLGILLVAALLLTLSLNIHTGTTSYEIKPKLDIAVNGDPNYKSYSFASSSDPNTLSVYKLGTKSDDRIDLRYIKDDEDTSDITFLNLPGDVNQFQILEKTEEPKLIDPALLNLNFLEKEGYIKNGRVSAIVKLKRFSGLQFSSLKNKFLDDLGGSLDLKYYLIKDLDFIDSVTIDIEPSKISGLVKLDTVSKVYLNRRVEATLDKSVPLINADDVWSLQDSKSDNVTGKGTKIAIIDTGVDYNNPDLGGCFGPACKVAGGYDFVNGDADPVDDHGHGTHVASTAAGNGILKGVAPDAKIYAYKVLDASGSGTFESVINGIKRAVDPNNDGNTSDHVNVISMSLGGFGDEDSPASLAVDEAVEKGVVVVSAAGNSGVKAGAIGTPGSARKGISVAATDKSDFLASFSSRGPTTKNNLKPDIAAPGVSICATEWDSWLTSNRCLDLKHIAISGTSMATPHVSGAAALLIQLHPDWVPEKIKSVLMSTAKDLKLKPWEQGAGRLDVIEATKAEITTNPASISFGLVVSDTASQDIEIENIGKDDVDISVDPGQAYDENGKGYSLASIDKTKLKLKASEKASINLKLILNSDIEGKFYGYLKIKSNQKEYRIPYFFSRLTGLRVEVVNGTKALSPYTIALRSDDFSVKKYATRWWDFQDNSYTFDIKGGNYTVFAAGDSTERGLYYILSQPVYLEPGASKTITLDLSKAKKVKLKKSIEGKQLDLDQIGFMFKESFLYKTFSLGLLYLRSDILGDAQIYLSDTQKDSKEKEISISYVGYPHKQDLGSGLADEIYSTVDSLYYIYWILNNVGQDTPTELNFTKDELAEYKYTYNLPGGDPNIGASDYGMAYTAVDFWTNPSASISASFGKWPAIPLERTAYVKLGKFSLDNYPYINYIKYSDDLKESAAEFGQREYDVKSSRRYWPLGVVPSKKESRTIGYGDPPYIPTFFENTESSIVLNTPLLKGNSKESFISKLNKVNYWSSKSGYGSLDIPQPKIKVYVNNVLGDNHEIGWNGEGFYYFFTSATENPEFRVELLLPVLYEIPSTIQVNGTFRLKQDDRNPPHIETLDISPRFDQNSNISLKFSLIDDKVSDPEVKAYYKGSDWKEILLKKESSTYSGSIPIASEEQIILKITASDGKNKIEYVFDPISKKAHEIDLGLSASKTTANIGDTITFNGRVVDKDLSQPIAQSYIKYFVDENFYDFSRAAFFSFLAPGSFKKTWKVPLDYAGNLAEFTISYLGSGIYKPKFQTFKIGLSGQGPVLNDLSLSPVVPTTEADVIASSVWTGAEEVLFESDYSGKSKNYTTNKSGNTYSYTIKSNKLSENQIVSYKFLARDSKNVWNTKMAVKNFTIKSVSKRTVPIIFSTDDNKGWGERWKFNCSVSDSDNQDIQLSVLSKNPQGDWETKDSKLVTNTKQTQSANFEFSFDPTYIGQSQIKCSASDNSLINESKAITINIEKDDVKLEVSGNNSKVSRLGDEKTDLGFKIFDADKSEYLQQADGTKIFVTKDSSEPYDLGVDCKIKNFGCMVSLNPDNTFSVGNQKFEGFISDQAYRISSTQKGQFYILGSLFSELSPRKIYKKGETVKIEAKTKDDTNMPTEPDVVIIEYRSLQSAGQWSVCLPVEKLAGGTYTCTIETDNLFLGQYDVRLTAIKTNYETLKETSREHFKVTNPKSVQGPINKTETKRGILDATEINVTLDMFFKNNVSDDQMSLSMSSDNPVGKGLTKFASFNKYLSIEPTENIRSNLSTVKIKIHYTDAEVSQLNFDENSLRLFFFNTTSNDWEVFDPPFGGVDKNENYVWANVTHLSDFAVGGKLSDGSSCSSSSDCSSGNCASDFDGTGSWCASSSSCASNGFVNYVTGSSTCYNNNREACVAGSWLQTTCSNGCSAGECIVPTPPAQNTTQPPSTGTPNGGGGSGGGSSGGSGGGGSGSSATVYIKDCTQNDYECTEWSECLEGTQIRDCNKKQNIVCKGEASPHTAQTCEGKKLEDKKEEIVKKITKVKNVVPNEKIKTKIKLDEDATNKTKQLIYIGATLLIILAVFVTVWQRVN